MIDTPSASSAITYGAKLSTAIKSLFPAIAVAVEIGIEHDPTALILQLCDVKPDDPAIWALHALLQVTDTALEHTVFERNDAQEQLQLRQAELQKCQSELQNKSDLCDTLSMRFASQPLQPTPSQPVVPHQKRLSKDPTLGVGLLRNKYFITCLNTCIQLASHGPMIILLLINKSDPYPTSFDGEEKNMKKRQQGYINWKSQLKLCFAQDSALFKTEKIKILHTVGLLTGEAYNNNKNKAIASTTARKKLLPIPELQTTGHVATSSTTAAVQILVLAVRTADVVWSVKDNMRSSSKPDSSSAPSTTLVKALVRPLHPAPNSAAYDH
ncbi:hypothetical protein V8E54_007536 [Elaphomyces granulatus]